VIIGIPKESFPGERRVALVPAVLPLLSKNGISVLVEPGAGVESGHADAAYTDKGASLASREELFARADMVAMVHGPGGNPAAAADLALLRPGQAVVGFLDPLADTDAIRALADKGVTALAMEMVPRITRAQSMDALSSMATVSGYLAVLRAASALPKFFPKFMSAAGSIAPSKIFILGAGVAGLQAISVARRLGGVVMAFDTRPVVKEQVNSLGAKFIELPVEVGEAQDAGGYAKAQSDDFYRRQQELMGDTIAGCDVVITTAAVPGKRSPVLVTRAMVERMNPGSMIVDLAAEKGGNCELTQPGQTIVHNGVTILGPINLASELPVHASQMYSKNIQTLLGHFVKDGALVLDFEDDITKGTVVTHGGAIVHPAVLQAAEA
jgi:NAD(P) transhydrogenase subunit alpha